MNSDQRRHKGKLRVSELKTHGEENTLIPRTVRSAWTSPQDVSLADEDFLSAERPEVIDEMAIDNNDFE